MIKTLPRFGTGELHQFRTKHAQKSSTVTLRPLFGGGQLAEWGSDPPERWSLELNDDVLRQWTLELRGTEAYEGETFRLAQGIVC